MKTIHTALLAGAVAVAALGIGIVTVEANAPASGASGVSAAQAETLWRESCASCHGRDGKGETRAGRRANVKDLTDAKYQESFPDERAFEHIKFGMERDGRELMKPFKDELNDAQIKALVEYLRKFDPKHPRDLSEAGLRKLK